jgi:hypothetical protein
MSCNASHARFIFGKFFTSTIILYVLLFAQNFYSCKKWVLHSHGKHAVLLGLKAKPTAQDWAMSAFSRGPRFGPMAMVTLFLFEIQLFSEINSEIHLNF